MNINALVTAWDLLQPIPMLSRFLLLGILVLAPLGACFDQGSDLKSEGSPNSDPMAPEEDGDNLGGGASASCQEASDCVLAASTCCECPTFAVPAGQGYDAGCEEVNCEPSGLCPAVEPVCDSGQCLLVCSPLIADKICNFGFVIDEAGCLLNECAASPDSVASECEIDADCVQVPADCCGCAFGGSDKAVPEALVDDSAEFLNCPVDPACPGIDVCKVDETAQCISGSCALVSTAGLDEPPGTVSTTFCGTAALPACATGSVCVLNDISANDASAMGVGSCVTE